jgi:hypothetical protein
MRTSPTYFSCSLLTASQFLPSSPVYRNCGSSGALSPVAVGGKQGEGGSFDPGTSYGFGRYDFFVAAFTVFFSFFGVCRPCWIENGTDPTRLGGASRLFHLLSCGSPAFSSGTSHKWLLSFFKFVPGTNLGCESEIGDEPHRVYTDPRKARWRAIAGSPGFFV